VIDFTRRKVLGVAAGTMASAISAAQLTEAAAADDAGDLDLFVKLSAALTGIDALQLAPSRDPLQIKRVYFKQAKSDPAFAGRSHQSGRHGRRRRQNHEQHRSEDKISRTQHHLGLVSRGLVSTNDVGANVAPFVRCPAQDHLADRIYAGLGLARRTGASHGLQRIALRLLVG
jgi:hypothetical protein